MKIVLIPSDDAEGRARAVARELATFIARVPAEEKNAERLDRRVFRWVLCGEHSFGRNYRETCPQCGGYAEPLRNHDMAKRLKKRKIATQKLMKQLAR